MHGKSRCHDEVAPTKQADFIMPSIAEICVPRFFSYQLMPNHYYMHRSPTLSWSLSGNVFRVADHSGTRDGWNRSSTDSVWNQPCVRVAVRESDLCPNNKSKRPDPFDRS